jgi:hypothetical protein
MISLTTPPPSTTKSSTTTTTTISTTNNSNQPTIPPPTYPPTFSQTTNIPIIPTGKYTSPNGGYSVYWNILNSNVSTDFTFESYPSDGNVWVGFALSNDQKMVNLKNI